MLTAVDDYEQAFESWLIDNRVRYVRVDQHKRRTFARQKFKSFDFLLYRRDGGLVVAEVKGRKFRGGSVVKLTGLESWVTMDDIRGLIRWEQVFQESAGPKTGICEAVIVFVYRFEMIDVETDGQEVYDFAERRYMFFAVRLDDYREYMTVRSPKWQTVVLPAAKFRKFAAPMRNYLFDGKF